jgi:hypothetical protein
MIHIGDAAFYAEVESRLRTVDLVLAEGIQGRSAYAGPLTAVYRWLQGVDRLDLVRQRIDYAGLGVPVICPDMSGAEFDEAWRQVPLRQFVPFTLLAPVAGIGMRLFGTRRLIAGFLGTDDLPSAEEIMASEDFEDVDAVIVDARDQRLAKHLEATHDTLGDLPGTVAVVYGAGHVRAIARTLSRLGYRATEAEWLTVFQMDVPER